MKRLCAACGHPRHAHQHYGRRDDTRCGLCACTRYRHPWPWRRGALHETPAPADTQVPDQNPVPGSARQRPLPPWRPSPAPVPAREPAVPPAVAPAPGLPQRHAGIVETTARWACGRYVKWDGDGHVLESDECRCPADWRQWEQEFAQ